jgi:hypothetical protein
MHHTFWLDTITEKLSSKPMTRDEFEKEQFADNVESLTPWL